MPALSQAAAGPVAEAETLTRPHLLECRDCGQVQIMPAMAPGAVARCIRCDAVLRRMKRDSLSIALAFNLAALALFGIGCGMTLMSVSTAGIHHSADMFSGPVGLEKRGVWELSAVVLFTTVGAPLVLLACMIYVLVGLRLAHPPRHLRAVFGVIERLRPWSMIEVYLLGVFVAYVKLKGLVHIEIGVALYALGALMLTMIAAQAALDPFAVWEEMERRSIPDIPSDPPEASSGERKEGERKESVIGCHICGKVSRLAEDGHGHCPRCGGSLHRRKPNAIARCWALVIASVILYVPANVYPVLTVIQLGSGAPSTILGGVEELLRGGMWPLAALVFFASIMVPVLKIIGLLILLVCTRPAAPAACATGRCSTGSSAPSAGGR